MHSLRLSDLGTSLLLSGGAIAITAAVVFATGKVVLPDQAADSWQEGIAAPTIDDLTGSQALLVLSGDQEGRYELNQLTVNEWNEGNPSDQPLKLSLTFRGSDVSLLITARDITPDSPARGDAASAIFSARGASYYGNNGECTITLEDLDYAVLEPRVGIRGGPPRGVPIPTYAGTVECNDIQELRTDRHINLSAVFRHRPEE